jgi:hypothetical protein
MYQYLNIKASNIRCHVSLQYGNESLGFFRFRFSQTLGACRSLSPSTVASVSRATSMCTATSPPMATDDTRQATEATELRQKLDAMVTAATDVKKKYDATHA